MSYRYSKKLDAKNTTDNSEKAVPPQAQQRIRQLERALRTAVEYEHDHRRASPWLLPARIALGDAAASPCDVG